MPSPSALHLTRSTGWPMLLGSLCRNIKALRGRKVSAPARLSVASFLFFQVPAKGPSAQAARKRSQVARDVALEALGDENVDEGRTHQPVFKATIEVEVRGAKYAPGQ